MVPKKLSSLQHRFVKYAVSLRKEKKLRREEKKVLILGKTMVEEFTASGSIPEVLFVQENHSQSFSLSAQEIFLVPYDILKKITGLPHPEPIAAIVPIPDFSDVSQSSRLLVLDGIADPGNLGTLLRTALALGWDAAYLLENTCDPFNEKALRAAKGATFRLPLIEGTWQDFLRLVQKRPFQVFVADVAGKAMDDCQATGPAALLLSRETQGAREESKVFDPVTIPMNGRIESLNVASAGAILLYHFRRNLHEL